MATDAPIDTILDPKILADRRPQPCGGFAGRAKDVLRRALNAFAQVLRSPAWRRTRWVMVIAACFATLFTAALVYHVYFDHTEVPNLDAFVRFELPATGEVYDTKGGVLIEIAHEYRRPVVYDDIPLVVRQAILSAEDKTFFSHSGVDYASLPRVAAKALRSSIAAYWTRRAWSLKPVFPQGGSTLTQQLVRGYFLRDRTTSENGETFYRNGWGPRLMSVALGVPATNKLLRKMEELRLSLWLEGEMRRRFGSKEQAKREIFARYASFIYLGHGRYGFAASSEYYFGKPLGSYTPLDAGKAALLAGMAKAPGDARAEGDNRLLRRRNEILSLMARNGFITEAVLEHCQAEPIVLASRTEPKTLAPGAVTNLLEEVRRNGEPGIAIADLTEGRISIQSTVDARVQTIVNQALEDGLLQYEKRHPAAKGAIQGSVVVLRNRDAGILAEAGGRWFYNRRFTRYSDMNRATDSLRQPGSAFKPIVYFAAFKSGLDLESTVLDEPIGVPLGNDRGVKWISNYDNLFKGPIPMRVALAESRNAVAIWLAQGIGLPSVLSTARQLGIKTPLQPYMTTALGASEVRLMELANVYRALASGIITETHVIENVVDSSGNLLPRPPRHVSDIHGPALVRIQEGLRGVVRLPDGTAHSLDGSDFRIAVMGKTGTTSDFRDALFVGSTYGPGGITVAVRVGFDDNRPLGDRETGGHTALPIFKDVMRQVYKEQLVGPVPSFPREIEDSIDGYLAAQSGDVETVTVPPVPLPAVPVAAPEHSSPTGEIPKKARVGDVSAPLLTEGTVQ